MNKGLKRMPFDTWICIVLAVGVTYGLGEWLKPRMSQTDNTILLIQLVVFVVLFAVFHALGAKAGLFPGYFSKKEKKN